MSTSASQRFSAITFEHFIILCAASVPALSLSINSGYSYGFAILVLLALCTYCLSLGRKPALLAALTKEDKYLLLAFCGYFLTYLFAILLDGFHFREMDRPSRFLLAALVLLFLLKYELNYHLFLRGIIIGAIGAGGIAFYQYYVLNIERAEGFQMAISFGNDAILLGLLSFSISAYYFWKNSNRLAWLGIVGGFMGLLASFCSGTRGGWVALVLLFFIGGYYRSLLGFNKRLWIIGGVVIFFMLTLFTFDSGVESRFIAIKNELIKYTAGTHKNASLEDSSAGSRLEMWKSAYYSFLESPLVGVGEYGSVVSKQQQIDQGLVHQEIIHFMHAHNEYLNALSQRGFIGFIALMLVYLVPLRLFAAKMKSDNQTSRLYAICGLLTVTAYMLFGLTQSSFSHNNGVIVYGSLTVFFWAAIRNNERYQSPEAH